MDKKCPFCGKTINSEESYLFLNRVKRKGTDCNIKEYYCNEQECFEYQERRKWRKLWLDKMEAIIGGEVSYSLLVREEKQWKKLLPDKPDETLFHFFVEQEYWIKESLAKHTFDSIYTKTRFFSEVVVASLQKYLRSHNAKVEQYTHSVEDLGDFTIGVVMKESTRKRRSLEDIDFG